MITNYKKWLFVKLAASKARLHHNRLARARIEFGDSSFAGRSAQSRLKEVNHLANPRKLFVRGYFNSTPGNKSAYGAIAGKRKSAARKLVIARKVSSVGIPGVSKIVSKVLRKSAGWKPKLRK